MAYNCSLRLDFPAALAHVEGVLGYEFVNEDLLREALYAGGPTYIGERSLTQANKPLAIFGDRAMDFILVLDGYKSGCSVEGINSKRVVAENKNLAAVGNGKGLARCITIADGTGSVSPKMMAAAVEAILGALYLDSGGSIAVVRKGMASLGLIVPENGSDEHGAGVPDSTSGEVLGEAFGSALV